MNNFYDMEDNYSEFGKAAYSKVEWDEIDSEMTDGQRRFINGLLHYARPNNVLELGVSAGGGTVCILNAVKNLQGGDMFAR